MWCEEETERAKENKEDIHGLIKGGGGRVIGIVDTGTGSGFGGVVGGVALGLVGRQFGGKRKVTDVQIVGHSVTKAFRWMERWAKTDFDGKSAHGDWGIICEWTEEVIDP
jgi:hypothetical protein